MYEIVIKMPIKWRKCFFREKHVSEPNQL